MSVYSGISDPTMSWKPDRLDNMDFLAQPFLPTGWVPLSHSCNAGGCKRGGALMSVTLLAYSKAETLVSDLRIAGRDCPSRVREIGGLQGCHH